MSRPSDDMTLEELREEYDWIYEFQSRMAERISGDPDVHNHVDYVNQLEVENAKLRELMLAAWKCIHSGLSCSDCRTIAGGCTLKTAMRELGIEVDA